MEINIGTIQEAKEILGLWWIIIFLFTLLCLMFIFWQKEHYRRKRVEKILMDKKRKK